MPAVTLSTLRARAQRKVDMEGSPFVPDSEWTEYLNRALWALDDKLHATRKDYYLTEVSTTLSGTSYSLPADYYQLAAVDVIASDGKWVSLDPYQWAERNVYRNMTAAHPEHVHYHVQGTLSGASTLQFAPAFPGPATAKVAYYPQRPALVLDADTVNYPHGWEEWAVLRAAIEARTKEEGDTSAIERLLALEEARLVRVVPQRDGSEPLRMVAAEPLRKSAQRRW